MQGLDRSPHDCAIIDCNAIIAIMASITVRNLEEATKRKLKVRAAENGRSMEQEVREILEGAVRETPQKKPKTGAELVKRIRAIWEPLGGVELELPPREAMRDLDWLKDWK
jgi:antitoxin FitA